MLVSNAIRYKNIRTFLIDVKAFKEILERRLRAFIGIIVFWEKVLFVLYRDYYEAPSILLQEKKKFLSLFARKSVQNILFFVQKIKKCRDIFKTISPRFQSKNKYFFIRVRLIDKND